jgi:hypothetical protein
VIVFEFIFRNFWTWLGSMLMLYLITNFVGNVINGIFYAFYRYRVLRKHGYPPSHCSVDGEFRPIKENISKVND